MSTLIVPPPDPIRAHLRRSLDSTPAILSARLEALARMYDTPERLDAALDRMLDRLLALHPHPDRPHLSRTERRQLFAAANALPSPTPVVLPVDPGPTGPFS